MGKNLEQAKRIRAGLRDNQKFICQLDKTSVLSNGEKKLKVIVDKQFQKELGVSIHTDTEGYMVENLQDAKVIDPFDYIEVLFEGISPEVQVKIKKKENIIVTGLMYIYQIYRIFQWKTKINCISV